MSSAITLQHIQAPIAQEMRDFEPFFAQSLKSDHNLLDRISHYIIKRKGKQMRPMLVFLSAKLFSETSNKTFVAASLIELLHTASLVHDDVVDEAMTRRGFFSVNALWKNKIAVLFGDYLLSRGLLISVENNAFDLLKIVATAVQQMSEGELLQQEKSRKMNVNEEVYYQIIQQKTASLIAACCQMGGAASNVSEEIQNQLYDMGVAIGIAFQIKDDLLDLGFGGDIGKPVGADIQENKLTLPLLHVLKTGSPEQIKFVKSLLKKKNILSADLTELQKLLMQTGSIAYAQQAMLNFAQKAKDILAQFPQSDVNEALNRLVDFTIQRNK
jgi:octaprenyl-diphosphate synthase